MKYQSGKELLNEVKELKITANFSDQEKQLLIEHYKSGDLNQYFDIAIQKALTGRGIMQNRLNITAGLLIMATDIIDKLQIDKDDREDIVANADTIYKFSTLADISTFENTEF